MTNCTLYIPRLPEAGYWRRFLIAAVAVSCAPLVTAILSAKVYATSGKGVDPTQFLDFTPTTALFGAMAIALFYLAFRAWRNETSYHQWIEGLGDQFDPETRLFVGDTFVTHKMWIQLIRLLAQAGHEVFASTKPDEGGYRGGLVIDKNLVFETSVFPSDDEALETVLRVFPFMRSATTTPPPSA